jgi:hypothetical protein
LRFLKLSVSPKLAIGKFVQFHGGNRHECSS